MLRALPLLLLLYGLTELTAEYQSIRTNVTELVVENQNPES